MEVTRYPSLEEALYLHRVLIARYGGEPGVRDPGLLASALHRPRSGYYETRAAQAAALLQSLCLNHAFVDGNKRVAFALTAVFLRMNGSHWVVDADRAEAFICERIIGAACDLEEIGEFVASHLEP